MFAKLRENSFENSKKILLIMLGKFIHKTRAFGNNPIFLQHFSVSEGGIYSFSDVLWARWNYFRCRVIKVH